MSTPEPPRAAPLALWRIAQAFLHTLYNLFGAPEDVAASHTLTTKAHKLLSDWLRAGEALMRRLLLIEATALAPTLAIQSAEHRSTQQRKREPKLMGFDANKPESWRVSFRCDLERRRLAGGISPSPTIRRRDAGAPSKRFHSAWPLAERYEALIRVFNAPFAYARRIARRLRQLVKNVAALYKHPPNAPYLVGPKDFAELHAAASEALRRFDTS